MRLPPTGKGLSTGELHTVLAGFMSGLVENILSGSLIEDKAGSQIQGAKAIAAWNIVPSHLREQETLDSLVAGAERCPS